MTKTSIFNLFNKKRHHINVFLSDKVASFIEIENGKITTHDAIEAEEINNHLMPGIDIKAVICQDNTIYEEVKVPITIKDKNVINTYIKSKILKKTKYKEIIFHYGEIGKDEDHVIYKVTGVDDAEYKKKMEGIVHWEDIKKATIEEFALLSVSEACVDQSTYISIHAYVDKIVAIGVDGGHIVFSRINTIYSSEKEALQQEMMNDIIQTTSYIKQQHRDLTFTHIFISGSLASNSEVVDSIRMMDQTPISVLYPNNLVSGLEADEYQSYILPLGMDFLPKAKNFIPRLFKSKNTYRKVQHTSSIILMLLLFTVSLWTINVFYKAYQEKERYEEVKSELLDQRSKTKMMDGVLLKKSLVYLNVMEKYRGKQLSSEILGMKELLIFSKPMIIQKKSRDVLEIVFQQRFNTLLELYEYEKQFDKIVTRISSDIQFKLENNSDYASLLLKKKIIITKNKLREDIKKERRI